ncbi:MAG: hypothetical protein D6698_04030 [Gammaproteobacteria bacterium]|nr:MAG: hypothetical protein D6698_04030 [Gammaproteobacteria bacterium]
MISLVLQAVGSLVLPNLRCPPEKLVDVSVIEKKAGETYIHLGIGGANTGPGHMIVATNTPDKQAFSILYDKDTEKWVARPTNTKFIPIGTKYGIRWKWTGWSFFGVWDIDTGEITLVRKKSSCLGNTFTPKITFPPIPKNLPTSFKTDKYGVFHLGCLSGKNVPYLGQLLKAGAGDQYSPSWNCPIRIKGDGTYLVFGFIDPDNAIPEWNEEDNWSMAAIEVRGTTITVLWTFEP